MTLENTTYELEISLVVAVLSMSVHFCYFLLLIKLIFNEDAWKKPINAMILFNEGVRFVASLHILVYFTVTLIWMEASEEPGSSFLGNGSMCKPIINVAILGLFWAFLDGAG